MIRRRITLFRIALMAALISSCSTKEVLSPTSDCPGVDALIDTPPGKLADADRNTILLRDAVCVAKYSTIKTFPRSVAEERRKVGNSPEAARLIAALDDIDTDASRLVHDLKGFRVYPYDEGEYLGMLGRLRDARARVVRYGNLRGPFAFPGPLDDWPLRYLEELLQGVIRGQGRDLDRPASSVLK